MRRGLFGEDVGQTEREAGEERRFQRIGRVERLVDTRVATVVDCRAGRLPGSQDLRRESG